MAVAGIGILFREGEMNRLLRAGMDATETSKAIGHVMHGLAVSYAKTFRRTHLCTYAAADATIGNLVHIQTFGAEIFLRLHMEG